MDKQTYTYKELITKLKESKKFQEIVGIQKKNGREITDAFLEKHIPPAMENNGKITIKNDPELDELAKAISRGLTKESLTKSSYMETHVVKPGFIARRLAARANKLTKHFSAQAEKIADKENLLKILNEATKQVTTDATPKERPRWKKRSEGVDPSDDTDTHEDVNPDGTPVQGATPAPVDKYDEEPLYESVDSNRYDAGKPTEGPTSAGEDEEPVKATNGPTSAGEDEEPVYAELDPTSFSPKKSNGNADDESVLYSLVDVKPISASNALDKAAQAEEDLYGDPLLTDKEIGKLTVDDGKPEGPSSP